MTTLVYRYGLAAPHENADLVRDQMDRAHRYRVVLTWIERQRRAEARAAQSAASAGLRAAEAVVRDTDAECARLAAEIRTSRAATRKRSETAADRDALKAARLAHTEAKRDLFALRETQRSQCGACRAEKSEQNPCPHATAEARALRLELDAIDARATDTIKWIRNECAGLYWSTYLVVERAFRAAVGSLPLYGADGVTPNDPRVPRWTGEGAVAVQLQGGLEVAAALSGDDTQLRIVEPPWPEAWLAQQRLDGQSVETVRGREPMGVRPGPDGGAAPAVLADGRPARWVRRRAARDGELRLRVQSDDKGRPVWAAWRMDMHRPLPKGATIAWATVHRRVRGPHAEWSLCVTVELPAQEIAPRGVGVVAIDVGWRQMPGGELRVAGWRDDGGRAGDLRLSATDVRVLRQPEEIRSHRDMLFDAIKASTKRWIAARTDLPDWLRDAGREMHAWRRASRMVALLRRWDEERAIGKRDASEVVVLAALVAWAQADRRYWEQETATRTWSLRRRREVFRRFAAKMADTYATIVLERFDLRSMAERKPIGEDEAENETARSNRQLAAVSEFRGALANAVRSRGASLEGVSAVDTTRTCPSCGLVTDRDAAASVRLECECGHAWDQDVDGAPKLLLERHREQPGDVKIMVGARWVDKGTKPPEKKGSQWARAKRMGAAKAARLEAAREAVGNSAE